jgi:predicted secreted protein
VRQSCEGHHRKFPSSRRIRAPPPKGAGQAEGVRRRLSLRLRLRRSHVTSRRAGDGGGTQPDATRGTIGGGGAGAWQPEANESRRVHRRRTRGDPVTGVRWRCCLCVRVGFVVVARGPRQQEAKKKKKGAGGGVVKTNAACCYPRTEEPAWCGARR